MSTRLNQLFGSNLITTQITSPEGGLPDGFPTGFMTTTKQVSGNMTSWDVMGETRDTGTVTGYGNPATRRNLASKSKGKAILMHFNDEIGMGQEMLNDILNSMGENDEKGVEEVARQTARAATILKNTRVATIISMLAGGTISVAPDTSVDKGRIVDSSYAGAVTHADLGIPAANLTNLGGIITAKWDIAGTAIATQMEAIQRQRMINGTPTLKYCGYGPGVSDALQNNTIVANMLRTGRINFDISTGIIEGLWGMTWYPLTGNFLKSSSAGAYTNPFAKKVVLHPEPSRDWYELHEGSYVIGGPGTPAVGTNAMDILRSMTKVKGAFTFARLETNPANIIHTFGDTFLPVLYQPSAIFIPTVLT